ncbi:MAG: DPP IV N-terminal domain-containing protein [Candidatus Aminicenantes bacterium]|nr:DPP IV N-terminal domain-containing protein [Candidatus Aminicenantes bacterium]
MKKNLGYLCFCLACIILWTTGAQAEVTREDYARAEQFLPQNVMKMLYRMDVQPNWIEESDRFWYKIQTRDGKEFILVDPALNNRKPAFDQARLAASLSAASGKAYESNKLPFETIEFVKDRNAIRFEVEKTFWLYDLKTYQCTKDEEYKKPEEHELRSPDGKWAAFVKEHNLYVRPLPEGEEIQLTTDGEPYFDYAEQTEGNTSFISNKVAGKKLPPIAVWSPDSKKILTHKLDERKVKDLHLLQSAPADGSVRPILHTYKYPFPGDEDLGLLKLVVLDVEKKSRIALDYEAEQVTFETPVEVKRAWWSEDSRRIYHLFEERAAKAFRLIEIDAATGNAREIMKEEGLTFVEMALIMLNRPNVRDLKSGKEMIWFSQRDGWAHLYLYDCESGKLKNRITSGPWAVFDIKYVDEANRWVYFSAFAREKDRDPYYRHLYRSKLDGSRTELLTSEDADHNVIFSPSGKYFTDCYSRLDMPPRSELRSADGKLLKVLEDADMESLFAMGWKFPERFRVKAADGVTDVYGMIVKPMDFDPEKKYPVIDAIYPGPQIIRTPPSFNALIVSWLWEPQSLAELGFIVVTIDGRGTPFRSKAFHDFSYKNFKDGGALQDHIAGFRQLSATRPYLDLSRVGIFGHSGGGFASTRAILLYPDFYKVAVSSAGNHDQRGYNAGWGEKYQGLLEGDNYEDQVNARLAANLKGKLLLAYGDMDDNVHPALTIQVIDELIKANKDFDMLVLPNGNHGFGAAMPYFQRRKWDYFVRNLKGEEPPKEYQFKMPE